MSANNDAQKNSHSDRKSDKVAPGVRQPQMSDENDKDEPVQQHLYRPRRRRPDDQRPGNDVAR